MERALEYRLANPAYTIYHRAALGGLAATIRSWEDRRPELRPAGIQHDVGPQQVRLWWNPKELTDKEALQRLLSASFCLSREGLIDLPGQGLAADRLDLRIAIHNGLCETFLQHPKMRPGDKEPVAVTLQDVDGEEVPRTVTYKRLHSYAHQRAQGTELLEGSMWPVRATVPQSMVPGATSGAESLEANAEEAVLLLYLMVGSLVFQIRGAERARACIVIPDVTDLGAFTDSVWRMGKADRLLRCGTLLGRITAGAEEAALRFLMDTEAADNLLDREGRRYSKRGHGVAACQVVAMGSVAWDKNQLNRCASVRLRRDYDEIDVYKAANEHMGLGRFIVPDKDKTGATIAFAVPRSRLPQLIAANLAAGRPWCAGLVDLIADQNELYGLRTTYRKGLIAMRDKIRSEIDSAVITAYHEAWRQRMGQLSQRSKEEGADFPRLLEVESERNRNAVLRAKTGEDLSGWLLRFCTEATKGLPLRALRGDLADNARRLLFSEDHSEVERLRNLILFAMLSYTGEDRDNMNRASQTEDK